MKKSSPNDLGTRWSELEHEACLVVQPAFRLDLESLVVAMEHVREFTSYQFSLMLPCRVTD